MKSSKVFIQQAGNRKDRYLILAEEAGDVTVFEVNGYVDIQKLRDLEKNKALSYQPR